jgi:hypothetical protein
MATGRVISAFLFTWLCASSAQAQDAVSAPAPASASTLIHTPLASVNASTNETIPLTVPKGTAVQVVLDQEVRIQKVGQAIRGHVVEPVYAFDKLVVPVGTAAEGQITKIEGVSNGKRTLEALNADFTPPRKIEVEFNQLVLANGTRIPVHTSVTPGSGQVIHFVTAAEAKGSKKDAVKDAATQKVNQAKQQAKQDWDNAMKQVEEPGKIHRAERYAVAQLPVHPQYIEAGTVYFAELQEPLDFGSELLTPEIASGIGSAPPDGSSVHARLLTPLSSATARKDDQVEAVLTQPLLMGGHLVLPQGSRLRGYVAQVRPARRLNRNGQLRITFRELIPPDGVEQKVEATLQGVQASAGENVKLDSESGAEATTPKTRYLATGISVGLAMVSMGGDRDGGVGSSTAGNTSNRALGGAGGFKLVGMVLGAFVRSRVFGASMGAYGAGLSVYGHFIARGHEVMFAKNTAMEIGIGTRPPLAPSSPPKEPATSR